MAFLRTTFILLLCAGLLPSCGSSDSSGTSSVDCGGYSPSTSLISGPAVGASGNNSDNPFRALAVHPTDSNTLYVGSEGNGLFKSSDGGVTWTWLRAGLWHCDAYPEIYSIAIDPATPSRLYIATNAGPGPIDSGHSSLAGIYRSTDSGDHWEQVNTGQTTGDANAVAIRASTVLIGLGGGQSTNAGSSTFYPGGIFYGSLTASSWTAATVPGTAAQSRFWQVLVRGSGLLSFGAIPTSGTSTLSSGILKSTDGGLNWSALSSPLSNLKGGYLEASDDLQTIYADILFDGSAPHFYKSVNGGVSWSNPSISTQGPIRIVGTDPNTLLVGAGHQILRSVNGLTSTSTVLTAASSSNEVMAIETAPSNASVVYATTKGLLVYKSIDGGASFTLKSSIRTYIDTH